MNMVRSKVAAISGVMLTTLMSWMPARPKASLSFSANSEGKPWFWHCKHYASFLRRRSRLVPKTYVDPILRKGTLDGISNFIRVLRWIHEICDGEPLGDHVLKKFDSGSQRFFLSWYDLSRLKIPGNELIQTLINIRTWKPR